MNTDTRIGSLRWLHLCLSVFICGGYVGAPHALAAPVIQVKAGWNGLARGGCWTPVRVTISGLTEPVEGRLEVEIADGLRPPGGPGVAMGEPLAQVATATPVSLAPGGAKAFTLFLVPASSQGSAALPLAVTARLRGRVRVTASGKSSLRLLRLGNRLLVTATGEPAGLQGWDSRPRGDLGWADPQSPEDPRLAEPALRVAHAAPEALPLAWNGYDAADLVLVTGSAWMRMSDRQRQALRLWVESGGRVILSGEQAREWDDREARLLVPGSLRDRTVALPEVLPGRRAAAVIRPRPEAVPFLRAEGEVVACAAPAGFGAVTWLGLDPYRAGVRRERGSLLRAVVRQATGAAITPSRLGMLADNPSASGLANTLPRLPAPSRGLLAGIALAYVLIFGPLNIRVLRTLSRGVTAWLFLPALAVAMTFVLLGIGRSWGQSRALLNRISVVEVMSGARSGWERGVNGLFSPTNAVYTLEAGDAAMLLNVNDRQASQASLGGMPSGYGDTSPSDPSRPWLREGSLPTLQLEGSSRWEALPLALWTLQIQQYERLVDLGGSVQVSLRRRPGDRPAGVVRNRTAFRLARAYLHHEGHRFVLGNLEPGMSREVQASAWVRRRLAEGRPAAPEAASREPRVPSPLYEEAILLLRPGGQGDEALLVAETSGLMAPIAVPDVTITPRAALLLVRARVERLHQ
jgi:hypothetical protein